MTTNVKCPACDRPLKSKADDGTVVVWCSYGLSCPSSKSTEGIKGSDGETVDELARKLIAQLEANPDWKD